MQDNGKLTLPGLLVIVGVMGILVMFLLPTVHHGGNSNRMVCMSNLSSINKALVIYRGENNGAWPWIANVTSDWSAVETSVNRKLNPRKDPNAPGERSMTSLMFLLVRMNQSPGMFRCPSDKNSDVDLEVKADANDGDVLKGEYYWDFAKPENVSYSWQAPLWRKRGFIQGLDTKETELGLCADMTPKYEGDEPWIPIPFYDKMPRAKIEKQMSHNHYGEQVNLLRAAGYVQPQKRPDVGDSKDNIYTAFGSDFKKRRISTSLNTRDHVHRSDTFLIGPVGRAEPVDEP